ncbi:MAG TPA: Uma2 family endonuclease, partial [Polyangiaceae bacterium]
MAQPRFPQTPRSHPELRYVRAPEPVEFPVEEEVPEGFDHLIVRTFLFRLLSFALGREHTVCSEQFVFWDASNGKRRLAPDVFVCINYPQPEHLGSWQTWQGRRAPDVAIEIVSPNEGDGTTWEEKIERYHQLGVTELVRFDPAQTEGKRLRVWDRVKGDLVERQIGADRTPCLALGLSWTVCPIPAPTGELVGLRLVDDEGRVLLTQEETEAKGRAEEAKGRAAAEARADAEAAARAIAEARVRELEEELRRRGPG